MTVQLITEEKTYTLAEYLQIAETANYKSEFRNGKIIKMPGAKYNHNKIIGNIYGILFMTLSDDYDLINSEQGIYVPAYNSVLYADNCIIKGEPEFYQKNTQTILNPQIVFEVASKSTERYDRAMKFIKYQTIPTFQEYVLVAQDSPIIEVYTKEKEIWQLNTYTGLDKTVQLLSVNVTLKMSDIYKKAKDLLDPQLVLEL